MKTFFKLKAGVAPAVLGMALLAGPAFAQDTAAQGDTNEAIVVTGSRIARSPEFSSPNPIVTTDAAAIEASGQTNLTEFLSDAPALLGSTRNIDVAGSNLPNAQLVGVNFLNLRNLGSDRTLVLVDGRRHVAGYPGTAAVDINSLPTDLIESVDVLTGGVSAIYGADGVSGVVNFRLKRDFEGLTVRAQNGISQRGDAGERFIGATFGKNFADGRGNIAIAYEFNQADRFRQRSRLNYGLTGPTYAFAPNAADGTPGTVNDDPNIPDRVLLTDLRWADSSMGGAVDLDGDFVPDFTGEGTVYDLGEYVPRSAFTIGGDSTPRESYYGDFTPYSRRHNVNVLAKFDVSSALKLRAEAKYVRSNAKTESQPSYDFYTWLQPDNAFLIQRFGADAISPEGALISRDNFDFGTRNYELDRELFRTVIGAEGDLSGHLRYDASFVFGQSIQRSTSYNERVIDRYYAAIDAVSDGHGGITCRINLPGQTEISSLTYGNSDYNAAPVTFQPGECVPLNILGNGSPSQAALDFVLADHSDYARIRQYVGTFALSGDTGAFFRLPGGPVGFAIGGEYRKETSYYRPSQLAQDGVLLDTASAQIEDGAFDVKEVFGEISLPVLSDVPFAKELSLGAALRLSDYSTVGSTTTWNANATWAPVSDITFRGTYSSSVRAPNISELYAPQSGTYEFIVDPCGIDRVGEGTEYRAANCAAALSQLGITGTFDPAGSAFSPQNSSLLGTQGGNRNLRAETAKTWTAGVVLRPQFVPNLMLSIDWYDIKLQDAINYASAQDIVDLCYDQPTLQNDYCALISRSSENGFINNYSVVPANVASYRTAGLDVNLLYRVTLSDKLGSLQVRMVGNYLDKISFVPMLGADPEDKMYSASLPTPRYSGTFDLTWSKGPLSVNYGINWWSKTRRVTVEQQQANPDYVAPEYIWYGDKWEHELNLTVDVNDKFTIYGGVNNLFDRKPDVGAVAYPISAVGRYFYAGLKAKM